MDNNQIWQAVLGEIELTSQQKTMARQFGITEEAYAKRLAEE